MTNEITFMSTRTRNLSVILVVALTLFLAACGSDSETTLAEPAPQFDSSASGGSMFNPVAGDWTLRDLTIEGDMSVDLEGGPVPTMSINGTTVEAFGGCSNFAGVAAYDIFSDSFSATLEEPVDLAAPCEPTTEQFFVSALERANTFSFDMDALTLSLTDGAEFPTTMTFVSIPAVDDPSGE